MDPDEILNIEAEDSKQAIDIAVEQYPIYDAFHVVGETIPSTGGKPGFYKIAAFNDADDYEVWYTENRDWIR